MKKHILDLRVTASERLGERLALLRLTDPNGPLPPMAPGQFAQVRIDGSPSTFLRRPISIDFVDRERNELWLLVRLAGEGTRWLTSRQPGDTVNLLLPLGRGFTLPAEPQDILLAGGGVGCAPLLYLGKTLCEAGSRPTFLLGARTADDLLQMDEFTKYGEVLVTTEDGSAGERGFATQHSALATPRWSRVCCCGPKPMMVAVARWAKGAGLPCEVSLENVMACGLGACLCCVEDTRDHGNVCVCKDGPVFNIDELKWQI